MISIQVYGQEPYSLKLNKSNGLPDNSIFNIKQDSCGFIWIASLEGLTRYDGVNYKTYLSKSQTSKPGSAIQEDSFGRIWYENFDGYLYYLEQNGDSLIALKQEDPIGYIPFGLTEHYLLVFQKKGIDVYNLLNLEKVSTFTFELSEFSSSCSAHNNFYFFNQNDLYKIDNNLNLKKVNYSLPGGERTKQIYADENGIFIVSKFNENKAIHFFDKNLNYLHTWDLIGPEVILGATYINGEAWIHSNQGTYLLKENGSIDHLFPSKSISCIIKDRQENYWIATPREGIFIAPNLNSPIHQLDNYKPNKIVKLDNKSLLIATKQGEIIQVDSNMRLEKTLYSSSDKSEITYLYLDEKEKFIAFSNMYFNVLDLKSNQLQSYDLAVKEIALIENSLYSFAASGLIGFFIADQQGEVVSSWQNFALNYSTVLDKVYMLKANLRARSTTFISSKQTIYYASNTGLFAINSKGEREILLNEESFLANKIVSFKNDIYALSAKGNLYRLDTEDNFSLLNESFNLSPYSIKALKLFGNQLVFISQQYVHAVNLDSKEHLIYNINISTYEINDLYLDEKDLYIVTHEGIIQIPSRQQDKNADIPPLFQITQFWAGNNKISLSENHKFNHNENKISIHFSLLDFGKINTASLFYSINGKEWIPIGATTRSLDFPELAPGVYEILFKVNEEIQEASIFFEVSPPFWKRTWFILLCVASIMALIYLYYRYRLNQLNQQIALLKANIELEKSLSSSILTSIKSQMNPHFFYNALNTIQAYIFDNDKRNASKYLNKFSKLTRLILEMSEREKISLQEEIEALTLYLELEKMRFGEDFNFNIIVDEQLDIDFSHIPSMLIQPYVENAIKHGLLHSKIEKNLRIEFLQEASFLKVIIVDNGIGRAKALELNTLKEDKPSSFSTGANEKRLAIINKNNPNMVSVHYEDLHNEHQHPIGTKVILRILLK
ncbi:MAG: histidine kinase [Chitinophagales bacterium]|nr:histidine kinase [Chitinophagales bacterium]